MRIEQFQKLSEVLWHLDHSFTLLVVNIPMQSSDRLDCFEARSFYPPYLQSVKLVILKTERFNFRLSSLLLFIKNYSLVANCWLYGLF